MNSMMLNGDKLELLRYGQFYPLKDSTHHLCNGQNITAKNHGKAFWVFMSNGVTFTADTKMITEVAQKLTGLTLRTKTREKDCILTLWKSPVLPRLKYCCQLWPLKLATLQR